MKTFCGGSGGGAAPSQTKESVPNEGRGPGRQVFGAGGPRAPAMAGRRPPIDPCTRSARRAPPTHSPRPRAAQPDPERLARAGMPALPTSGWAAVFGFMGMGKSVSRCRCCHLLCCWPHHSIYLNPIHNCRCIREAPSMPGHMPENRTVRVRSSGVRRPTSSSHCHSTTRCQG